MVLFQRAPKSSTVYVSVQKEFSKRKRDNKMLVRLTRGWVRGCHAQNFLGFLTFLGFIIKGKVRRWRRTLS